jgi:hypothetical protein
LAQTLALMTDAASLPAHAEAWQGITGKFFTIGIADLHHIQLCCAALWWK